MIFGACSLKDEILIAFEKAIKKNEEGEKLYCLMEIAEVLEHGAAQN